MRTGVAYYSELALQTDRASVPGASAKSVGLGWNDLQRAAVPGTATIKYGAVPGKQ